MRGVGLILAAGGLGKTGRAVQDKWWFSQRFHTRTYHASYSAVVPTLALAKFEADLFLVPPKYKKPAGRPAKLQKDRSHLNKISTNAAPVVVLDILSGLAIDPLHSFALKTTTTVLLLGLRITTMSRMSKCVACNSIFIRNYGPTTLLLPF